jgi:hypothetical protein
MSNKKWKFGGNGKFFLKKNCLLVFLYNADDAKLNGNKKKETVPRKGRK